MFTYYIHEYQRSVTPQLVVESIIESYQLVF